VLVDYRILTQKCIVSL